MLLVLGPVVAGLVAWVLPESYAGANGAVESVTGAARATAGLGAWMALWWITEAVDPSVTALLPIAVLPLFGGMKVAAVCAPYAHPLVFLFLGGFLLSIALQRWELHRRFALAVVGVAGTSPSRLTLGFMVATALLSMWVSNTATVVVMLPIALSVLSLVEGPSRDGPSAGDGNLPTALLLSVAYAGSIGGMATLVGSPPNLIAASTLQEMGIEVDFLGWLSVGLPASVLFLPIAWWWLTRRLFPVPRTPIEGAAERIAEARAGLGPMRPAGRRTLGIFALAALAW
ncbi:MAG: anion transporter, partial [Deltaproteobacteria bacterium]